MKTKKIVKSLSLSKETIANLDSVKGGDLRAVRTVSYCLTVEPNCAQCPTTMSKCIACP